MTKNILVDMQAGEPAAIENALHRVECMIRYVSLYGAPETEETEDEIYGRQLILDLAADALADVAQRVSKQKPVAAVGIGKSQGAHAGVAS